LLSATWCVLDGSKNGSDMLFIKLRQTSCLQRHRCAPNYAMANLVSTTYCDAGKAGHPGLNCDTTYVHNTVELLQFPQIAEVVGRKACKGHCKAMEVT